MSFGLKTPPDHRHSCALAKCNVKTHNAALTVPGFAIRLETEAKAVVKDGHSDARGFCRNTLVLIFYYPAAIADFYPFWK